MSWLIKNLLKLAKLDEKAIELKKKFQSLNETIQESIDALGGKAINNIIKNSVEHTPKGGQINI